ncbi:hypothetical protein J6590_030181 [Homalodisca vitripennis]|nr:hypothetical protein J6590_030181 [Homalodisca vitripennis]
MASGNSPPPASADVLSPPPPSDTVLGVFSRAAVVSVGGPCAGFGRDILAQGGNAVDAVITTLLCDGVCVMQSNGVGGGFVMTIYNNSEGKAYSLIARETAPGRATRDIKVILNSTRGRLPKEEDKIKLPILAKTLSVIANSHKKADELYSGSLTKQFVKDIQAAGGIITEQDMKNYANEWPILPDKIRAKRLSLRRDFRITTNGRVGGLLEGQDRSTDYKQQPCLMLLDTIISRDHFWLIYTLQWNLPLGTAKADVSFKSEQPDGLLKVLASLNKGVTEEAGSELPPFLSGGHDFEVSVLFLPHGSQ